MVLRGTAVYWVVLGGSEGTAGYMVVLGSTWGKGGTGVRERQNFNSNLNIPNQTAQLLTTV